MVESSLGIVGASLPLLRPIFMDWPAKDILSSLRAMVSRFSLRSSSADGADMPPLDYAKLEAGSVGTPREKFEGVRTLRELS